MSIKLKLVSCISAFILVLGIFIFGVLSAEQATVNLGGSISFDATDVYARVTGKVQNAQTNPTLDTLEFSATNDSPDQSSWSGLELQFDSRATNITIEVTVENLSMERTLTVNLTDMMQTSTDNLDKSITLDNGAYVSGTNTTVPVATSNDENNTSKITFIITFDVIDHNRSLPSTDFDYDINLMDENYEPVYEILEGFSFNENGVLLGYTGNEPNVVIPSSYSIIGVEDKSLELSSYNEFVDYMNSNDATLLTSMLNITVIVDGTSCGTYPDFTTASSDNAFMVAMQNATQSIIFEYQENISVVGQSYTVTGISMGAFMNNNNLESITIPEGITSIGNRAFYKCTNLTEINYNAKSANDLTVYNYVFGNAGRASEGITVNFGEGVEKVPAMLFRPSIASAVVEPNIIKVNFSSTITSIGDGAFQDCNSLTSVTFGDNSKLTTIGSYAFSYCSSLTSITIPDSVTSIGNYVFDGCSSLTSITIPSSVTSIGERAFYGCQSLSEVTIDSRRAYQNAGAGNYDCGALLANADTVYVKANLVEDTSLTASSYLTSNFTRSETAENGYYVYTRN